MLILHIAIALTSLIFSTYLYFAPSDRKLHLSYGLVGLTLATGTYLVWSTHAQVLQACMSGLLYLGVVAIMTVSARAKLATQKHKKSEDL